MKKLWSIIYFSLILATALVDIYTETFFIQKIGVLEAISNLVLIFYYISNRQSRFIHNDWLLIEALLFTCVGGIIVQLYDNEELLMFINTVGL